MSMNKKIFFTSIIIVVQLLKLDIYSQGTWESIESPTNQMLTSVHFIDSLYGWAVGDSGTIIHTSNGGNNWDLQNSNTLNRISDVFFLNRNLGWASSWNTSTFPFGTLILKTTNGGQTWTGEPYPKDNIFIQCILYLDSLNGWMGGKPHALVSTSDGGLKWKQAYIDSTTLAFLPIHNIKFLNSLYGYACGGVREFAGVIWKTTNGGDRWVAIEPMFAAPDPVQQIHIIDEINLMGVGGDLEVTGVGVIRTTDGGNFWEYESIGIPGIAIDLDFRNEYEAWAPVPSGQSLVYSLDAGTSWTEIPAPERSAIADLVFPDSLHGFAVGKKGAIIKYKPPVVNSVNVIEELVPGSFKLYQNYPNPFNPKTVIKYSISQDGFVKLDIFNSLGEKITSLVDENKKAGIYKINFSASELTSGIYFYKLQAGDNIETKKMILLK
jgi:photosystem II stability/assembly factor-like uncharacterized protein